MASVQERARQIELREASSKVTSSTPEVTDSRSAAPQRRVIEWSDIGSSGFPSRYRANGNILDFEGISLEDGPRPLLPPRPIDEVCEARRASDGGAVCTLTIKRNPLCDTFEAMSTTSRSTRTRSKSVTEDTRKIPAPILITDVAQSEAWKGSDFGPKSAALGHEITTEYDPYCAPLKTANLMPSDAAKGIFGAFQEYLKTPNSPNIASMKESISQSMSPVLSSARQGLEQASKSMKKLGENVRGLASQPDGGEMNLMAAAAGLRL